MRGRPVGWIVVLAVATACAGSPDGLSGAAAETPSPTNASFQLRPVVEFVAPSSPEWDATPLSCAPEHDASGCSASPDHAERIVLAGPPSSEEKWVLGPVIVDGADVAEASARRQEQVGWFVAVELTPEGSDALAGGTRAGAGAAPPQSQIAIVVGTRVVSAPAVQQQITSGLLVVNGLTETAARDLASDLNASS